MIDVRIVKDWSYPNLMRQTPGGKGIWGNCRFTLEDVPQCDYVILLNNRFKDDIHIFCAPQNVWGLMQEPYIEVEHDWMIRGHKQFYKVFTHYIPKKKAKYRPSQPATPWHVNRTFDQLSSISRPPKSKALSWISSSKSRWPGHRKRLSFLKAVQQSDLDLDYYGRGINEIEDKWDGLAPYKYSIAIENYSGPDYWTEKLADCFLSWTIPIYFGCTNLTDYFPSNSFIKLDISSPDQAIKKIHEILMSDKWEERLDALEEARNLYLYKYQFFPYISHLIEKSAPKHLHTRKKEIRIVKYKQPLVMRTIKKLKSMLLLS